MFTPQQIQDQTFSRAVFGGYDMAQADAFLEPLTDDYIELYKENAVLKSKMKAGGASQRPADRRRLRCRNTEKV